MLESLGGFLLVVGIVVFLINQAKNKAETTKTPTPERELGSIDLIGLDQEFDLQHTNARRIDHRFLFDEMFSVLAGVLDGKDEFERHEFEKTRPQRIDELKSALYQFEFPIDFSIGEYNFERKVFRIAVKFTALPKRRTDQPEVLIFIKDYHFAVESDLIAKENGYGIDWEHHMNIPVSDIEVARTWKRSGLEAEPVALVLAKPLGAKRYFATNKLAMDLVGLRIHEKGTRSAIVQKFPKLPS